jgi:hypothetical protein
VKLTGGAPEGAFPVDLVYQQTLSQEADRLGMMGRVELCTLGLLGGTAAKLEGARASSTGGVPVNKIEVDLYVPEEYAYCGFSGTLHPRPRGLSNTLLWVLRLGAPPPEVHAGEADFESPPPPLGQFTTQGRLFRFQTLAPEGTLRFLYVDRKLYWLFDLLVFAAVLALGVYLVRRNLVSRLWTALGCVLFPLCLAWFTTSDAVEPFGAAFVAGLVLSVVFLAGWIRGLWDRWRETRLARAPDPFLEDAVAPAPPAGPPDEPKAEPPALPAAGPPEPPKSH